MRIKDRPEFATKPKPFALHREAAVAEAVARMVELGYGCVVVVDGDERVVGIVTERDVMKRLVNRGGDPAATRLGDIMTSNPRTARETDSILDWLRMMSNERFRRLPITDAEGRLVQVMTQGDFVSYTWPDLMYDRRPSSRSSGLDARSLLLIAGGVMLYSLVMILLLRAL
jgi:CBS domain-containing protein